MGNIVVKSQRIRVCKVPEKSEGYWGFAEQLGVEAPEVFVHASELVEANLPNKLLVGNEYVCDVDQTERGLRAVNLQRAD